MTSAGADLLLANLRDTARLVGEQLVIDDASPFRTEAIDRLVIDAVFNPDEALRDAARWLIWSASQALGCGSASIHDLYLARGRGEFSSTAFTVPAINGRAATYLTARQAFAAALERDAGAVIFEIAKSEMAYTDQRPAEYTAVVLAAAGMEYLQVGHRERRPEPARVERAGIVHAVEVHDWNGPGRPARREHLRTRHRGDGRDALGGFDGETPGHHGAVGQPRRVDAPPVHGLARLEVGEECQGEADVVHLVRDRVSAAGAGIPRQQPVRHAAGAIWIDGEEALGVGDRVHARILLLVLGAAAAAVEVDDDGKRAPFARGRRHVDDVGALAPAVLERDAMVAGSEGGPGRTGAERHERERKDRGPHSAAARRLMAPRPEDS